MDTQLTVLGQFLAVGWSDGVVRLMGLENNKAAHHIPVTDPAAASITHIAWASSAIAASGSLSGSLKDGVAREWKDAGATAPVDLPRELTFLEVDTALPKISPLPTGSAGAE